MTFDINNCWMGVAIDDTGNEMHRLEIAAYNGAMLSNMKTHDVSYVDLFSNNIKRYFPYLKAKTPRVPNFRFF